jgi:hypothetical protein
MRREGTWAGGKYWGFGDRTAKYTNMERDTPADEWLQRQAARHAQEDCVLYVGRCAIHAGVTTSQHHPYVHNSTTYVGVCI